VVSLVDNLLSGRRPRGGETPLRAWRVNWGHFQPRSQKLSFEKLSHRSDVTQLFETKFWELWSHCGHSRREFVTRVKSHLRSLPTKKSKTFFWKSPTSKWCHSTSKSQNGDHSRRVFLKRPKAARGWNPLTWFTCVWPKSQSGREAAPQTTPPNQDLQKVSFNEVMSLNFSKLNFGTLKSQCRIR